MKQYSRSVPFLLKLLVKKHLTIDVELINPTWIFCASFITQLNSVCD